MHLADFPSGHPIFVDTNCLVYHFLNQRPVCTTLLHRSELGDIATVTSAAVVGEMRHRLMILEASERFQLPPRNVLAYLKQHPQEIKSLTACVEATKSLSALQVHIVPLLAELILAS